jgi:hypothetical protein
MRAGTSLAALVDEQASAPMTCRVARGLTMAYSNVWEKPVVRLNDGEEAERALDLLETNDIDFDLRERGAPAVSLEWNGIVYQGLFGIADFLMFVARQPIPGVRKSERAVDGRPPGFPIQIPRLGKEAGP